MVLTEALAHGLPVVASDTGGVAEAVGAVSTSGPRRRCPAYWSPRATPTRSSAAVRGWLEDPARREQLRGAARVRRAQLPDWSSTARSVEAALRDTVVNQPEPLERGQGIGMTITSVRPAAIARRSLGRVRSVAQFGVAGLVLVVLVLHLGAAPFLRAFDRITIGSLVAALLRHRGDYSVRRVAVDLGRPAARTAPRRARGGRGVLPLPTAQPGSARRRPRRRGPRCAAR